MDLLVRAPSLHMKKYSTSRSLRVPTFTTTEEGNSAYMRCHPVAVPGTTAQTRLQSTEPRRITQLDEGDAEAAVDAIRASDHSILCSDVGQLPMGDGEMVDVAEVFRRCSSAFKRFTEHVGSSR